MNPVPALPSLLDILLSSSFDNDTAAAIQAYDTNLFAFNTSNPDALRTLAAELVTLDTWQCPLQQVLNVSNQQSTFSSLYSFRFDRGMSQSQATIALPQSCSAESVSGVDRVCHSEDGGLHLLACMHLRPPLTLSSRYARISSAFSSRKWRRVSANYQARCETDVDCARRLSLEPTIFAGI
jgi:hypothetical protein